MSLNASGNLQTWWKQASLSIPGYLSLDPRVWWPQHPKIWVKCGCEDGKLEDAKGWSNSKSYTITCKFESSKPRSECLRGQNKKVLKNLFKLFVKKSQSTSHTAAQDRNIYSVQQRESSITSRNCGTLISFWLAWHLLECADLKLDPLILQGLHAVD